MNNNVAESTIQLLDASELDNVDQVKDLLGQGVNPNAQDEYGLTALMVAAGYGGEKVAEHLLSLPTIDTEMRDKEEGWTAMLYAAGHGHLPLLKILLQHGADPGAVNNHSVTALMEAAANGLEEVAKCLLSLPSTNMEARSECGATALLWAASFGHLQLIKLLLHSGANIEAVDDEGDNVLTLAAMGVGHIMAAEEEERELEGPRQVIQYLVEEAGFPVTDRVLEEVAGDVDTLAFCLASRWGPSSLQTLARRAAWSVPRAAWADTVLWRIRILRNFVNEE